MSTHERLTGSTELENDGTGAHAAAENIQEKQHFCRTMDLKIPIPHWEPAFPELQVPQPFSLSVSAHAMHFDFSKRKSVSSMEQEKNEQTWQCII